MSVGERVFNELGRLVSPGGFVIVERVSSKVHGLDGMPGVGGFYASNALKNKRQFERDGKRVSIRAAKLGEVIRGG